MNTENTKISSGIGRRKQSIAKVILKLGNGKITINNKMGSTYLQDNLNYIRKIHTPLFMLGIVNFYDVCIKTNGGGLTGQTDAITLAIARVLAKVNNKNRSILKKAGLLTSDARIKERKKYGLKKARKDKQFSKR